MDLRASRAPHSAPLGPNRNQSFYVPRRVVTRADRRSPRAETNGRRVPKRPTLQMDLFDSGTSEPSRNRAIVDTLVRKSGVERTCIAKGPRFWSAATRRRFGLGRSQRQVGLGPADEKKAATSRRTPKAWNGHGCAHTRYPCYSLQLSREFGMRPVTVPGLWRVRRRLRLR